MSLMLKIPKSYYAKEWSVCRGNSIYKYNTDWYYWDGWPYDGNRRCEECKLPHTIDSPDPCLGIKPGIISACCGHGGRVESIFLTRGLLKA